MARGKRKPAAPRPVVVCRYGPVALAPPGGWGVYDYDAGRVAEVFTGLRARRKAFTTAAEWNTAVAQAGA